MEPYNLDNIVIEEMKNEKQVFIAIAGKNSEESVKRDDEDTILSITLMKIKKNSNKMGKNGKPIDNRKDGII